ncbi:MAG: hypothetical protein IKK39_04440 [Thermoguttaceae bacterium]|nr:hypothetical protein [Thermoguttaceae bacterium]MBR4103299.1 hypothetical protein [Thermoguttaceae bacterium]
MTQTAEVAIDKELIGVGFRVGAWALGDDVRKIESAPPSLRKQGADERADEGRKITCDETAGARRRPDDCKRRRTR